MKKTKIVCTMGPMTDKPEVIEQMITAGMNVARFNFSHGTHAEQGSRMNLVRSAAQKAGIPIGLMLDTKGPEMRLGLFAGGKVDLIEGNSFVLTTRNVAGTAEVASVNFSRLHEEVKPGDRILLSDGLIGLKVEAVVGDNITTSVLNSGVIGDRKRVAVPGVAISLPPLSEQDIRDIQFGIDQNVDFIAASFIQRAADVLAIRRIVEDAAADIAIIAKIENAAGVENIDEILQVADGIMVARGDLGVEIPAEDVPLIQKQLIKKANAAGKPVITATQMLESMIHNPRPTRAEASDIANAIFDGTDAIMLSGETANGKYPVEAVQIMATIALRTEAAVLLDYQTAVQGSFQVRSTTDAISHATVQLAFELGVSAIVAATVSGQTARMVSKYRPAAVIVAQTHNIKTFHKLLLSWGVYPVLGQEAFSGDDMVAAAVASALRSGIVKQGDLIVITAGLPVSRSGTTNMIRVHTVGTVLAQGVGIGNKTVSGRVCVIRDRQDMQTKKIAGTILVLTSVDESIAARAAEADAIVTEEGGLTSQAAIIGICKSIPVIVGSENAVALLTDGMTVTIDAEHGLIYEGIVQVR
ncbi:pyruvate kinase [Anaerospora sp.]|uniref:pyruvate kinase n=1 Tax=Anaerospora sp. TaxID=1960278 RepID=UPI00289B0A60|nr:pyruvate kinase [Anaerospora sp.]